MHEYHHQKYDFIEIIRLNASESCKYYEIYVFLLKID